MNLPVYDQNLKAPRAVEARQVANGTPGAFLIPGLRGETVNGLLSSENLGVDSAFHQIWLSGRGSWDQFWPPLLPQLPICLFGVYPVAKTWLAQLQAVLQTSHPAAMLFSCNLVCHHWEGLGEVQMRWMPSLGLVICINHCPVHLIPSDRWILSLVLLKSITQNLILFPEKRKEGRRERRKRKGEKEFEVPLKQSKSRMTVCSVRRGFKSLPSRGSSCGNGTVGCRLRWEILATHDGPLHSAQLMWDDDC